MNPTSKVTSNPYMPGRKVEKRMTDKRNEATNMAILWFLEQFRKKENHSSILSLLRTLLIQKHIKRWWNQL